MVAIAQLDLKSKLPFEDVGAMIAEEMRLLGSKRIDVQRCRNTPAAQDGGNLPKISSMKTIQMRLASYATTFALTLAMSVGAALAAPLATLQVEQGILIGAKGVVVNGRRFDVSFEDGTCETIIAGCNFRALTFTTLDQANVASYALAAQVFADTKAGAFDSNPALTRGCSYDENCLIFTPYFLNSVLSSSELVNWSGVGIGVPYPRGFDEPWDVDTTRIPNVTFARWTLAQDPSVQVPEPSVIALLAIAGFGLLCSQGRPRRRMRRIGENARCDA
jgi:hypothetical protein